MTRLYSDVSCTPREHHNGFGHGHVDISEHGPVVDHVPDDTAWVSYEGATALSIGVVGVAEGGRGRHLALHVLSDQWQTALAVLMYFSHLHSNLLPSSYQKSPPTGSTCRCSQCMHQHVHVKAKPWDESHTQSQIS